MRTLSTSRPSGGVVIKLKAKINSTIKIIIFFILAISCCFLLYYLIDNVLNGSFVDWFTSNFMYTRNTYSDGKEMIVQELNWWKIKVLLLWLICINVVFWIGVTIIVSHYHAKKKVKKSITRTSNMIQSFMNQAIEPTDIFSNDYAEIATQMVQIKSTMQRHEQVLKEEAARKNDLITYLAHDLKTPLTSVIGYLSLLDEAADMPFAQREKYVHIALDKAYRLENLTNEFFEITRYNLQQIILENEKIDLYYMLIQLTDEFYPILKAHGNKAEIYANEDLTVYGDPEKLARVFNNIFKNAISYSYPDTVIEVRVENKGDNVCISFSNKGKTIPKQRLDAIFEKFFRLDESRTAKTGGAGLGLAIAKEIVTLHGGQITASSEDDVTTFYVTLPIL